jgi:hydroxymethylpyrimidine pyrophosphatase-like HAD family hydrolase
MTGQGEKPSKVSLLIADVDDSLINEDEMLTKRAQAAVKALDAIGIAFAVTSGRPTRGRRCDQAARPAGNALR